MQFGHPRFETPRSVPLKKGVRAVAIFISDNPAWAEVCLNSSSKKGEENWLWFCAGQNRHGVENERVSQKGVATHPDLESRVAGREAAIEA